MRCVSIFVLPTEGTVSLKGTATTPSDSRRVLAEARLAEYGYIKPDLRFGLFARMGAACLVKSRVWHRRAVG